MVVVGLAAAISTGLGRAAESDVVINELMYHPPEDREDLQFVELYNRGPAEVVLKGWHFTHGIQYAFAPERVIAAHGFLVVCRNQPAFAQHYGKEIIVAGEFAGRLSHSGERLALANARGEEVDAVTYGDRDPWPSGPDGRSASLERICPSGASQDPANWAGSALPRTRRAAGTPGGTNDSFSPRLPPVIKNVLSQAPQPGEAMTVTAEAAASEGVRALTLQWRVVRSDAEAPETEVVMARTAGDGRHGTYQGTIPGQPPNTVVRFRLKATDEAGSVRWQPSPNEPRPTHTYATFANTNTAAIPFAYVFDGDSRRPSQGPEARGRPRREASGEPARGSGTFIYLPPGAQEVLTFDHVAVRERPNGFKVHFQPDRPFKGMTGINIVFDGAYATLCEPLSYELFQRTGVPAPAHEHARVWRQGRPLGYQLLLEQPNKAFLARHQRDTSGHLYKLIWRGRGLVGQHEKKSRVTEGHADLVQFIDTLNAKSGPEQWDYIQKQVRVEEFINYYAVCMLVQNWDGFWNNYYVYHDTGGSRQWEIYPWDEDKTWGAYDSAARRHDWYEMPLTMGMKGDRSPLLNPFSKGNNQQGPYGVAWWRPPGWFSGPLLANPQFRQRFLSRLRELCETEFTARRFEPVLAALEKRLEPEMAVRAAALGRNPQEDLQTFRQNMQAFRDQLQQRRAFILREVNRPTGWRAALLSPWTWAALALLATAAALIRLIWRSLFRPRKHAPASLAPPVLPPPWRAPPRLHKPPNGPM